MNEKRTPEVGDVWKVNFDKAHVLFVSQNAVRVLYRFNKLHPKIMTFEINEFKSVFKCIGKAKGSIDDLFVTE